MSCEARSAERARHRALKFPTRPPSLTKNSPKSRLESEKTAKKPQKNAMETYKNPKDL